MQAPIVVVFGEPIEPMGLGEGLEAAEGADFGGASGGGGGGEAEAGGELGGAEAAGLIAAEIIVFGADKIDDTRGPAIGLAAQERGGALAAQLLQHLQAQLAVILVQMLKAKGRDEGFDLGVNSRHRLGDGQANPAFPLVVPLAVGSLLIRG